MFYFRFGACHPMFYIGSLENALKDSLQCRARDVSIPMIYDANPASLEYKPPKLNFMSNIMSLNWSLAEEVVSDIPSPWQQYSGQRVLLTNPVFWECRIVSDQQLHAVGLGPQFSGEPRQVGNHGNDGPVCVRHVVECRRKSFGLISRDKQIFRLQMFHL